MTGSPATLADISRMLMVRGSGEMLDLSAPTTPDGALPRFTVTHYQRVFEFSRRRWRQDLTRVSVADAEDSATEGSKAATATAPQRQVTAVDNDVAFDVGADGTPARAAAQVARERRAELYHHPVGFLQAVFSGRGVVSNTRREGNFEAVDMTVDGTTYTMFVDPATRLPARITSTARLTDIGDVLVETTLAHYTAVQGHRLPGRMTTSVGRWVVADLTFDQQSLAGNFGDLAAPAAIRDAVASRRLSPAN